MDQLYEQWLQSQKPGWGDETPSNSVRENGKQIHMPTDYAEEVVRSSERGYLTRRAVRRNFNPSHFSGALKCAGLERRATAVDGCHWLFFIIHTVGYVHNISECLILMGQTCCGCVASHLSGMLT